MKRKSLLIRWLPHPFVSVLCGLIWLMLNHSIALSEVITACLIAIIIPKLSAPFIARTPNIQWQPSIYLFFTVLWDIVVSNFVVAKLVLGPKKNLEPKWFRIPLETKHEQVNSLLAMIITTTPGTVSAGIDQARGDILVHALNAKDPDAEIKLIKQRYEQPLIQIFSAKTGVNQ
ncbi:Na+/H+ antiporter subunit E [Acinetobacter rathckeae]|uniref:Na+/H+ antiporter subunit E n=1 Tax=Acinetobacter rathckeae TaxID=2605272 RepID=UPI0018A28B2D|nr:Na+/H+ antiporter subunit E [Acinetobacter rathckeae]MBF7688725.1 Na+/H+ antiporter subunit E [Acinetobacter rathckeae]MBF7696118.1 Na+/H+ antiporter subunit E [Acinetobacter rathckeae]